MLAICLPGSAFRPHEVRPVYTYNNIRPELYLEFIHADSVGEFYNQRIKRNHKQ